MTDKIPMTQDDLARLIEEADLVMLVYGERRFALGPDIQAKIVASLRTERDLRFGGPPVMWD